MKANIFQLIGVLFLIIILSGCNSLSKPQQPSSRIFLPEYVENDVPKDKDIIFAVMLSAAISTDVDPLCKDAGRELSDQTIGEYLSGYLAELSNFDAKNKIELNTTPKYDKSYGKVWHVRLLITQNYDEVYWSAGLDFLIERDNRKIIPGSFRCIGSG